MHLLVIQRCPRTFFFFSLTKTSLVTQTVKNLPAMWETWGLRRSPGEGNGNPLQYSGLENSIDRAWQVTVRGVAKSQTTKRLTYNEY